MFVFIWTGKGYLVLLAMVADILLTALIGSALGFQDATVQIYILEFLFAVILFSPIWIYGRKWNAESKTLIEKESGKEILLQNAHKAFWIPMQYWAFIYPLALLA